MDSIEKLRLYMRYWRSEWNAFILDFLRLRLDQEQRDIVDSVQYNQRTAVSSGTARGKDFVAAAIALCGLYLTPEFDEHGKLVGNTKVFMTAPTFRQVNDIMVPEVRRIYRSGLFPLPGRLVSCDIRTNYEEWFLTGFKASDDNTEAWSGLHAAHIMFILTEASGISETIYNAIEGNLQGDSRLLLVFNPNITSGYAARAMMSERFKHFRLNSLNAENVVKKKVVIPGQVDYEWVKDKVELWTTPINADEADEADGDFQWEGEWRHPNDLFRIKVLGLFPRASEDVLIPYDWIEMANQRWIELQSEGYIPAKACRLGVDVAGMGRDCSVLCPRYDNYVKEFIAYQSSGKADHMHVAGMIVPYLQAHNAKAFIDTIGEGAGVYSRLLELGFTTYVGGSDPNDPRFHKGAAYSCKYSEGASKLHDVTGQYSFANMRAYCYWALRDWLNPKNGFGAALPPNDKFAEEATATKWKFQSNGAILIEPKEDIKKRIKRSPDYMDALANTFYPYDNVGMTDADIRRMFL